MNVQHKAQPINMAALCWTFIGSAITLNHHRHVEWIQKPDWLTVALQNGNNQSGFSKQRRNVRYYYQPLTPRVSLPPPLPSAVHSGCVRADAISAENL